MNLFLILFSIFYFAQHLLDSWLTWLNIGYVRKHRQTVPVYFQEKITLEEYQKSIAYTCEKARFGMIASWVEVPIFWGLLLSGFYQRLDVFLRSLGFGPIVTGLLFLATVSALFFLLSLPFGLYSTFVIEQKYGFNRMTLKLWLVDLFKGILLSILMGGPTLAAILWFMDHHLQGFWWLYVWILLSLVQIFVAAIFPVFLLPLFNKLTPLEDGSLKERIYELARKINFRLSGIYAMDGSKRSTHSNAFFAGLGKFRRIVLFDTLVKSLSEPELLAVLAHEMGHNVKKHVRTGLLVASAASLAGLCVLSLLVNKPWFYDAFQFAEPSPHAALLIFMKTADAFTFFLAPLSSILSRKHEYEADRFAAEVMERREPMIQGLVKLTRDNLSNLTPHPLYSFFYYSHPTVMERIRALERI
ncbi:MAG: M48 family metallopeptidase [Acidobacteria bacterium]|nr:M48 family metallopeptidase [Acidobacteriota bacterium]MCI0724353.1 M48 family metallopeptidase [Acidobacteriota bacterium]